MFVLTQPLPSLRRSPHPALRATFPQGKALGTEKTDCRVALLLAMTRPARSPTYRFGAETDFLSLRGGPQGRRGNPYFVSPNHKKALPPWGFQGGRGRRGRGCSLGWRGQPRLNSGDFSRCSGRAECSVSSFVSDQGEWITSARQRPAPRRPRSCRSGSWRRPCSCPDRWRGPCP